MIEVSHLTKDYGTTRAVNGISFSVRPGEIVGLLGPNGAGKSTTLRMLTGSLPPTSGTVRVEGLDVSENSLEIRRKIGYLSEINPLYESLGVWECLELFARLREIPTNEMVSRVNAVVAACSLKDVMSKDVGALSKGYRQRLGLALAIVHDPLVLILDEPTSALDPNRQKEVRDLIGQLKEKKTVLLSTHILSEARKICDRLLIIHRGVLVAQGTVDELQKQWATNGFFVRLRGPVEPLEKALFQIPGVVSVERQEEKDGCPGFRLIADGDPRDVLGRLAVEHGWPIMELSPEGTGLDEIFSRVTEGA